MSGFRSKSKAPSNVADFRHELFFTDENNRQFYPEYDPAKGLDQFKGQTFDAATCERLGLDLAGTPFEDMSRDVVWSFRRRNMGGDAEEIGILMAIGPDWQAKIRDYMQNGGERPRITADERTTYQRAELCQFTAEWEGTFFHFPSDLTIGDVRGTKDTTRHQDAGTLMPVEPWTLTHIDEPILDAATAFLKELFAGRTPDEQASFSEKPAAVDAPRVAPQPRGKRRTS